MTWSRPGIPISVQFMKALLTAVALVAATVACASDPDAAIDWPFVGSEQTQTKYSVAEEITTANIGELEIVWQWDPNEEPLEQYSTLPGPFQATPIMVDGVLFLSTMYTRVAALDAETGAEIWTFDPRAYEGGPVGAGPTGFKHRGIAHWARATTRAFSSTAATGYMRSMPRPVKWTVVLERVGAYC